MRIAPEYAAIPYNNTTLPISSPISMWKEGTKGERIWQPKKRGPNKNYDGKRWD